MRYRPYGVKHNAIWHQGVMPPPQKKNIPPSGERNGQMRLPHVLMVMATRAVPVHMYGCGSSYRPFSRCQRTQLGAGCMAHIWGGIGGGGAGRMYEGMAHLIKY